MKKFVKPLVIAASVAAVAGIGAVSFAKWSGGTAKQTQDVTTGSVTNFLSVGSLTPTAVTGLLPWDQKQITTEAVTPSTTDNTMATIAFTVSLDAQSTPYNLTIYAQPATSDGITFGTNYGDSSDLTTELYVSTTAPAAAMSSIGSDWAKISNSAGSTTNKKELTNQSNISEQTIYIILDSNDSAQMTKGFVVTVEVTPYVAP